MGSGKWATKIERGAQRQLESLTRPDLVKEAAQIIDDLADDPRNRLDVQLVLPRGQSREFRLIGTPYAMFLRSERLLYRVMVRRNGYGS